MEYIEKNKYDLLSKFNTVDEFNNHFEQAMLFYKDKFTKSEYEALNKLRKFAFSEKNINTVGVAWCRAQKVVAATHKENMFGISRSSFDRMLRKAKKLNLIKVINQYRKKDKYQKHNVYVFNRFEELTPGAFEVVGIVSKTDTIDVAHNEKIEEPITLLLELPVLKDLKTYSQAKSVVDKKSEIIDFEESKTEYQQVSEQIDGLFADKKMKSKIYGVWLSQTKEMFNKVPFEICLQAIKTLILEVKRRNANEMKPLKNPAGYFNGILSNKIDQYLEREIEDSYRMDWDYDDVEPVVDAETKQKIFMSIEELEKREHYLKIKSFEALAIKDMDRFLRRKIRLLNYEKMLSEVEFAPTKVFLDALSS